MCRILFFCLLFVGSTSFGSSIVQLSLPDIADHSGQVVRGKVASLESYWTTAYGPRTIETKVTLDQVSYFKGQRSKATQFTYTVPGGTVGDMTMRIAGAPEFKQGEEWVLFLLPEWKSFPTVGLHQGAYQLVDGEVRDGNGVPVASIDEKGFIVSALHSPKLEGRARGANVSITSSVSKIAQQTFLEQISTIARNSKSIQLQHDAGKRIRANYTSVPFRKKQ